MIFDLLVEEDKELRREEELNQKIIIIGIVIII